MDSFAAVAFPRWNVFALFFSFKTIENSNKQIRRLCADAANEFIRLISLINSYLAFSFSHFFYDNVFTIRCTSSKVESINLITKISAFEFVTFIVFGLGWPGLKKITIRENQVPCFLTQMAYNIRCTLLEDALVSYAAAICLVTRLSFP